MADQTREQRISDILKRTKVIFIQDAVDKIKQIQFAFEQWEQQQLTAESLIETIHLHVHPLKGLALTLSYHHIDQICQEIIIAILHREKNLPNWTTFEISGLRQMLVSLQHLVDEAAMDAQAAD